MKGIDNLFTKIGSYPWREDSDMADFDALVETVQDEIRENYIELPVDADGVPIHVGDVVDVMPTDKFTGHRNVVVTSVIFKHSAALVTIDTPDRPFTFMPNRIRHHYEPTVEDVLRDFAQAMSENMGLYTVEAIDADEWRDADARTIAEYAAKLRLADDGKEQ